MRGGEAAQTAAPLDQITDRARDRRAAVIV